MNTDRPINREEPIRLFKSDFLEFFSHITPQAVALLWTPLIIYFFILSFFNRREGTSLLAIPAGIFIGWFVWTFVEYMLHRFIFHYHPKTEKLKKMFFVMHGVHHAQPMCKTRLVMPPALSVPLAVVFYGLFYLIFARLLGAENWLYPLLTGFVAGYLIYDLTHYNIHHSKIKQGIFFAIRKHHLRHHGTCDFLRFGVSLPLWDYVFGTMPKSSCAELLEQMNSENVGEG